MINLKKLFRRKKGQGALEYLFMIAAALIIIFVVVRYISGTGQQATSQSDIAALQSQAELVKSSFQSKGWWETSTWVYTTANSNTLQLGGVSGGPYSYTFSQNDYPELYQASFNVSITTAYSNCQAGNNLSACQVFGVLGGSTS